MESLQTKGENFKNTIFGAIFLLAITIAVISIWCGRNFDLRYPIALLGGDETSYMSEVKMMLETHNWYKSNNIGAPYGTDRTMSISYYLFNDVHYISFFWVIMTKNVGISVNLTFFTLIFLNALFAFLFFRYRKLEVMISLLGAISFAFQPYVLMRNIGHIMLAAVYTIPICFFLCFEIAENDNYLKKWTARTMCHLICMFLIINSGIGYYTFFSCFFIIVTGIIISFEKRDMIYFWKSIKSVGIMAIMLILILVRLVISFIQSGGGLVQTPRSFGDVEIYSLKIARLFIPPYGTPFERINNIISEYNAIAVCEGDATEYLGLIGVVGFILLLITFLRGKDAENNDLKLASKWSIMAILYSTIGGFCVFVFLFVTQMARCTNRISIYIGFLSIFCVLIFLKQWKVQVKYKKTARDFVILFVFVLGMHSQLKVMPILDNTEAKNIAIELEILCDEIENISGEGCMIYQAPFQSYPDGAFLNTAYPNAEFMPYLYSEKIRWSYGAMRGESSWDTNANIWNAGMIKKDLQEVGYGGVLVDTAAFSQDDLPTFLNKCREDFGEEVLTSMSGRWKYFSIE